MATYNRALDLMALAAYELSKGNTVNASTLLHRASADPSLQHALRMVEATNDHAAKVEAKAKQVAAAKKQVKANHFEDTDEETLDLLNDQGVDALEEPDPDAVPAVEIEDEDEELEHAVEASAKAFAQQLASILKKQG